MKKSTEDNTNNNNNVKRAKLLFFEKQGISHTCRLHAINNALGRSILSRKKFFGYCDEFDMQNRCRGSREFFFIDTNHNIISFILNKFHVHSSYYPPDDPPDISEGSCDEIMAVMIFSPDHIWCVKKSNNTWFNLDSLSNGPKPVQFRSIFSRQGFGWIIVWKNFKSVLSEQSFEVYSKVAQNLNTDSTDQDSDLVIVNQLAKSPSKRSKKRNHMETDAIYDESLSIFETSESCRSNRFEILSSIGQ